MDLHKLLLRQLSRIGLTPEECPTDIEKWKKFIDRINNTYYDADQDHYLLDRSVAISSREMKELNEKLSTAQKIARLGYWSCDHATGKMTWSKELYEIFELNLRHPAPTIHELIELTHEQDRQILKKFIKDVFSDYKESEIEIRVKHLNESNQYQWVQFISRPNCETSQFITQSIGIAMDIQNRKLYEEQVRELNNKLVSSARRAGMADVATSILHNVGNILNSINVSVGIIFEMSRKPYHQKIYAVEKLIQENLSQLTEYVANDDKGKLLLPYLISLADDIESTQKTTLKELDNLSSKVAHIKDITQIQRSLSGISGMTEKVNLLELIDLAIKMCSNELTLNNITVIKDVKENYHLITDRTKLLQIIVNLVQNAKDALVESNNNADKKLSIVLDKDPRDFVSISVIDNGIGIAPNNIDKIFSLGFTTKTHGHGFGLHGSAISAKELGGCINAESLGLRKGAKFILTLPLSPKNKGDTYATKR